MTSPSDPQKRVTDGTDHLRPHPALLLRCVGEAILMRSALLPTSYARNSYDDKREEPRVTQSVGHYMTWFRD